MLDFLNRQSAAKNGADTSAPPTNDAVKLEALRQELDDLRRERDTQQRTIDAQRQMIDNLPGLSYPTGRLRDLYGL